MTFKVLRLQKVRSLALETIDQANEARSSGALSGPKKFTLPAAAAGRVASLDCLMAWTLTLNETFRRPSVIIRVNHRAFSFFPPPCRKREINSWGKKKKKNLHSLAIHFLTASTCDPQRKSHYDDQLVAGFPSAFHLTPADSPPFYGSPSAAPFSPVKREAYFRWGENHQSFLSKDQAPVTDAECQRAGNHFEFFFLQKFNSSTFFESKVI